MLVVREAYLTIKQMEQIGIQDASAAFDEEMQMRKKIADDAARRLSNNPYVPLFEENNMDSPAGYYFPGKEVIIPAGINGLIERIFDEWDRLDPGQATMKYLPASSKQVAQLHTYLNQFVKSNGVVTEPAFGFMSSVHSLLFRKVLSGDNSKCNAGIREILKDILCQCGVILLWVVRRFWMAGQRYARNMDWFPMSRRFLPGCMNCRKRGR